MSDPSSSSNISIPVPNAPSQLTPAQPAHAADPDIAMEGVEPGASQPALAPTEGNREAADPTATTTTPAAPAGESDDANRPEEEGEQEDAMEFERTPQRPLSYVDYLKSPVITLAVGPSDNTTHLSAHQLFLQQSPYLSRIITNFTHDTPISDRFVSLPDEDIAAVASFLEFLYTGEYCPKLIHDPARPGQMELEQIDGIPDPDEDGEQLLRHANIYTLAEKLEMPRLKELAHHKIHRINSSAKGELRYARFVYKHTSKEDRTIRGPIASFWAHRSHVLRHEAEDEFRRMVLEFPQFAYDILQIVLDQKEKSKEREAHGTPRINPSTPAEKVPRTGRKRPRTSTAV